MDAFFRTVDLHSEFAITSVTFEIWITMMIGAQFNID